MELPDDVTAAAQELLEADLTREFSTTTFATPEPMSIQDIDTLLKQTEACKQRIICHPDDFDRVSAALDRGGLGLFYTVQASRLLDPGQAILMPSEQDTLTRLSNQTPI